jgi:two-component system chemotaxis response regulator CheB
MGTHAPPAILALAASTGGPKALYDIFSALPPFVPFPIMLVQHIGAAFVAGFVEWLQTTTQIQIKVAQHDEPLVPNVCYVAPGGRHLAVRLPHTVLLDDGPPIHSCRPSADILFTSIAKVFGSHAVGVLLTGIGEDGAQGLLDLKQAGAATLVQDEESSVIFGMPKKAIELNAAAAVGNIPQIVAHIKRLFQMA